ncbi:MAG: MFS transporter, partial [Chloroflexi bacterium]
MAETGLIRSWKGLLALYTVAGFIETIFWGQMNAFTPLYLGELGVPEEEITRYVGITAAVVGFAGLPFLPFWGALADRYARKPVIVRSFVVYLVAGTAAMLAQSVWLFIAGRAVMSLALGNSGLMMTTLAERTPNRRQALAFSIMNSAGPVGIFLGPLIGGPVVDRYGFRVLMAINLVLLLVVVLALTFGYHDSYRGKSREPVLRMA